MFFPVAASTSACVSLSHLIEPHDCLSFGFALIFSLSLFSHFLFYLTGPFWYLSQCSTSESLARHDLYFRFCACSFCSLTMFVQTYKITRRFDWLTFSMSCIFWSFFLVQNGSERGKWECFGKPIYSSNIQFSMKLYLCIRCKIEQAISSHLLVEKRDFIFFGVPNNTMLFFSCWPSPDLSLHFHTFEFCSVCTHSSIAECVMFAWRTGN